MESAKRNLENASNAWRDSSKYITLELNEEIDLKFHPDITDGVVVKQDTFQGEPSGWKTFYQVTHIGSANQELRIFKANRNSSKFINAELAKGHWSLRIKRVGLGTKTLYQPTAI